MKRLFLIPLMLLTTLVFSSACSEDNPPMDGQEQNNPGGNEGNGNGDGNDQGGNVDGANERYLVLYCSRTGNTGRMAQTIQSALDCDMIVVEPETPYEDDYNAMLDRAQAELKCRIIPTCAQAAPSANVPVSVKHTERRNSNGNKNIRKRRTASICHRIGLHGIHAKLSPVSRP